MAENIPFRKPSSIVTGRFLIVMMARLTQIVFLIVFVNGLPIWGPAPAVAAGIRVEASVDRNRLVAGESLVLRVIVEGGDGEVDASAITDFDIAGTSTSSSVRIVNGNVSRYHVREFTLTPRKTGQLAIPALAIRTDDGVLNTNPIAVVVTEAPSATGSTTGQDGDTDTAIRVEAELSNTSPFVGEQIRYTFRLYQFVQMTNARLQVPDFTGFTATQAGDKVSREILVNGRRCYVTEAYYILIPVAPGEKNISPARLSGDVQISRRNRRGPLGQLDDFFMNPGQYESRTVQTQNFSVTVQPLPAFTGKGTFSGLVGDFDINAELNPTTVAAGDSATLSLTVRGTGNIPDAGRPDLVIPDGLKLYQDEPEDKITLAQDGYTGTRTFRYALVPVSPGVFSPPPVELTYFDPKRETYVIRQAQVPVLTAKPAADGGKAEIFAGQGPDPSRLKKKVEYTGHDLLPLKDGPDALISGRTMPPIAFLVWILGPGLGVAILGFWRRSLASASNPSRIMAGRARESLASAAGGPSAEISAGDILAHLHQAVTAAVFARCAASGKALTPDAALARLMDAGTDPDLARKAADLLCDLEAIRFGGAMPSPETLEETRSLVRDLVRALLKEAS